LREDLQNLGRGLPARNEVLVYAPRGHGKTVLLSEQGIGRVAAAQGVAYFCCTGGRRRRHLIDVL